MKTQYYVASTLDGFIATEDPRYNLLRIVPDHGIFFEFVPMEDLGKEKPTRHTLATVETGAGSFWMTACITAAEVLPANGFLPVSSS